MSKPLRSNPGAPSKHRAAIGREVSDRLDRDPRARRMPGEAARIYRVDGFATEAECAELIARIEMDLHPSQVFAEGDWVAEFRNSLTCDMHDEGGIAFEIDARITALLGIPADHGEPLQGQRYEPGQHFRAHCDWFEGDQPYWPAMLASGGQRTWTAMLYLDAVEEGGATWFPRAGVRFAPRPGTLIAWNNMRADGSPNLDTVHEGMRVISGVKHVLTKWYRESGFHFAPAGAAPLDA